MDLTYSIETPLLLLLFPPVVVVVVVVVGLRKSTAYCRVETAERHIRWTRFAAIDIFMETIVVVVVVSVAAADCS